MIDDKKIAKNIVELLVANKYPIGKFEREAGTFVGYLNRVTNPKSTRHIMLKVVYYASVVLGASMDDICTGDAVKAAKTRKIRDEITLLNHSIEASSKRLEELESELEAMNDV